jgi:hypothetical protein
MDWERAMLGRDESEVGLGEWLNSIWKYKTGRSFCGLARACIGVE